MGDIRYVTIRQEADESNTYVLTRQVAVQFSSPAQPVPQWATRSWKDAFFATKMPRSCESLQGPWVYKEESEHLENLFYLPGVTTYRHLCQRSWVTTRHYHHTKQRQYKHYERSDDHLTCTFVFVLQYLSFKFGPNKFSFVEPPSLPV